MEPPVKLMAEAAQAAMNAGLRNVRVIFKPHDGSQAYMMRFPLEGTLTVSKDCPNPWSGKVSHVGQVQVDPGVSCSTFIIEP